MKKTYSALLIGALCLIFPLIEFWGYNYILRVKLGFFGLTVLLCFLGQLYGRYCSFVSESDRGGIKAFLRFLDVELTLYDHVFFAYMALNLLSFLTAEDKTSAFFGVQADGYGFLYMLLVLAMFLCFKLEKDRFSGEKLLRGALIAGDLLVLLAVLQFFGLDLLRLMPREPSPGTFPNDFLSTLGNTGLYGAYVNMLLGLSLSLLVREKGLPLLPLFSSLLYGIGLLCANTDASYLGFAAALFGVLLWGKKGLRKLLVLMAFLLAFLLLSRCFGAVYRQIPSARSMSALTRKLVLPKKDRGTVDPEKPDKDLSGLWRQYTEWNDDWGNGRGFVWSRLLNIYRDRFGAGEKLLGAGQGSVLALLMKWYEEEITGQDYIFSDAHSELMTLLMTLGALGLAAFLVLCLLNLFGRRSPRILRASLLAYLAMSIFGITQPITATLLWLLLCLPALELSVPETPDFSVPEA